MQVQVFCSVRRCGRSYFEDTLLPLRPLTNMPKLGRNLVSSGQGTGIRYSHPLPP